MCFKLLFDFLLVFKKRVPVLEMVFYSVRALIVGKFAALYGQLLTFFVLFICYVSLPMNICLKVVKVLHSPGRALTIQGFPISCVKSRV